MTLQEIIVIAAGVWVVTNIIWLAIFIDATNDLADKIKQTRYGLRSLCTALGFEYSRSWNTNEIHITYPWGHNDKLPATRADVEKFFAEHEERLNAVYKHLGIQVVKKTTPMTPAKSEVVVSKVSKN